MTDENQTVQQATKTPKSTKKDFAPEPHSGKLRNSRGTPAELRLRAEKAAKNIGKKTPKKEEAKKADDGPKLSKWTLVFICFIVLGSAVVTVLSKMNDEGKALENARAQG